MRKKRFIPPRLKEHQEYDVVKIPTAGTQRVPGNRGVSTIKETENFKSTSDFPSVHNSGSLASDICVNNPLNGSCREQKGKAQKQVKIRFAQFAKTYARCGNLSKASSIKSAMAYPASDTSTSVQLPPRNRNSDSKPDGGNQGPTEDVYSFVSLSPVKMKSGKVSKTVKKKRKKEAVRNVLKGIERMQRDILKYREKEQKLKESSTFEP